MENKSSFHTRNFIITKAQTLTNHISEKVYSIVRIAIDISSIYDSNILDLPS